MRKINTRLLNQEKEKVKQHKVLRIVRRQSTTSNNDLKYRDHMKTKIKPPPFKLTPVNENLKTQNSKIFSSYQNDKLQKS